MMNTTRETTNGIKWLEANMGEMDIAYDPRYGWVSINWDYAYQGARSVEGIRWELSPAEIVKIPQKDRDWVLTGDKE